MAPRNRTECDREIVTLLAERHSHNQAAEHRSPRSRTITRALEEMRHCYTTPATKPSWPLPPASSGSIRLIAPRDITPDRGSWLKRTMALKPP
jgi:hypothetical protein